MEAPSWPALIRALIGRQALTAEQTAWAMNEILEGAASPAQIAGFGVALRAKGETPDEVAGLAAAMLQHARRVDVPVRAIDVVGTGGDQANTVNISSMAAVVVAAAGVPVVKHGNRAASSATGTADVLEALGVRLDLPAPRVAELAGEVGITFCFAQLFHPAFRHAAVARRELGVPTAFNFLGPLTNPAGAGRQLIGVSDPRYLDTIAGALGGLGGTTALVVSSEDGLDEISVSAPTRAVELKDGGISSYSITPESLGVEPAPSEAVGAADPDRSAEIARAVLSGAGGAERSLTVANAGAAIYVGGRADSLENGVRSAEDAIDSGAAREAMERFVERTQALAAA